MRRTLTLALSTAFLGSAVSAATFEFTADDIDGASFYNISGTFSAYDTNGDGFIDTSEVLSFRARALGGTPGGPSAFGFFIDSQPGESTLLNVKGEAAFFNVNYEVGSLVLSSFSFGFSQPAPCSSDPFGPIDSSRQVAQSIAFSGTSGSYNTLGEYTGAFPGTSWCANIGVTEFMDEFSATVSVTETGVIPLPASVLFLLSGLGGMAFFAAHRRSSGVKV
jgi:hypothetical protein